MSDLLPSFEHSSSDRMYPGQQIEELKVSLEGNSQRFSCSLVWAQRTLRIIAYTIGSARPLSSSIILPAKIITHAFFWLNRPYNVYRFSSRDQVIAWYFNIADQLTFTEGGLRWRDLVGDILVDKGGTLEILDSEELAPDLNPKLRLYIDLN